MPKDNLTIIEGNVREVVVDLEDAIRFADTYEEPDELREHIFTRLVHLVGIKRAAATLYEITHRREIQNGC